MRVGRVRSIVIQLGHPIINEHTITLHFDRYIYSRNYFEKKVKKEAKRETRKLFHTAKAISERTRN